MTNEGIETLLALERHKVKPISEEEVEELLKFFCGKEEEMVKFSREQKQHLLKIADQCQEAKSLGPLFALIYISDEPLTEYELQHAKDLIGQHKWDVEETQ